jgi:hypothetical protein
MFFAVVPFRPKETPLLALNYSISASTSDGQCLTDALIGKRRISKARYDVFFADDPGRFQEAETQVA